MLLTVEGMTVGYQRRPVVHDFELGMTGGEMVGLIGPNGAGKSTVLHGLAGLRRPISGAAFLDGQNVQNLSSRERARQIALVPQGEMYAWPLSVEEIVSLGRAPHRGWLLPYSARDRAAVARALTQTELVELRHRPVDGLSAGERQRTLIARALAQEPRVLLLDEPTANLDLRFQVQVLELVRRLAAASQLAVIIAIHDLTLAARYCDRVLLLHHGRAVATGPAAAVFTPGNLRTVFGIRAELYRDPYGQWAISVRCD